MKEMGRKGMWEGKGAKGGDRRSRERGEVDGG